MSQVKKVYRINKLFGQAFVFQIIRSTLCCSPSAVSSSTDIPASLNSKPPYSATISIFLDKVWRRSVVSTPAMASSM
jgi:hypothetical protein